MGSIDSVRRRGLCNISNDFNRCVLIALAVAGDRLDELVHYGGDRTSSVNLLR